MTCSGTLKFLIMRKKHSGPWQNTESAAGKVSNGRSI